MDPFARSTTNADSTAWRARGGLGRLLLALALIAIMVGGLDLASGPAAPIKVADGSVATVTLWRLPHQVADTPAPLANTFEGEAR
ncbi:hypothetical protein FQ775_23605 [Nitratireductor mangrovi]|uniref:Uncharacterized protein n=1 Tax=Nitratireductor mangrovi TaxID=2599600 RepID=A0A5B8L528_9HYPH|nr:hypothetical protein [Nitratireductor mangrovi]QDZ03111.1 hypothetical protein FQ775_23605 [Nitratireductor mangrovi]